MGERVGVNTETGRGAPGHMEQLCPSLPIASLAHIVTNTWGDSVSPRFLSTHRMPGPGRGFSRLHAPPWTTPPDLRLLSRVKLSGAGRRQRPRTALRIAGSEGRGPGLGHLCLLSQYGLPPTFTNQGVLYKSAFLPKKVEKMVTLGLEPPPGQLSGRWPVHDGPASRAPGGEDPASCTSPLLRTERFTRDSHRHAAREGPRHSPRTPARAEAPGASEGLSRATELRCPHPHAQGAPPHTLTPASLPGMTVPIPS